MRIVDAWQRSSEYDSMYGVACQVMRNISLAVHDLLKPSKIIMFYIKSEKRDGQGS